MPKISSFYGIIIMMFWDDHNPPHFHVKYGEYNAVFTIEGFVLVDGSLPPRAHGLVIEWASQHKDELIEDWNLAITGKPLKSIEPLN